MLKKYIIFLIIVLFTMGCASSGNKKQELVNNPTPKSATRQDQNSNWLPFKGVLLRHIVANCCFSDSQNTVILGQDNNSDSMVDKCYQLKGKNGKIYYRTIKCPDKLAPVSVPPRNKNLHCNLN